ncbi:MAG: hypothetical protein GY757_18365, partial [bacterium]|nr:hypothetical protein [bacterium]
DKDGDILSTSSRFYVGYYNYSYQNDLAVRAHQATNPGEKFIDISIEAPKKGTALFTVENKKTLDHYFITLDTPFQSKKFQVPLKEDHFPTVKTIAVAIYEDGTYEEDENWLEIQESVKKLNVEILPRARELLPSTQSKLTVKVTGKQGKGKKARVFVYAVNEATLRLIEWYRSCDLFDRL